MGQLGPCPGPRPQWGASSRSRLNLKIIIRIISKVKYHFRLYSPENWEFRTTCQLAKCDDRRPRTGLLGLPPCTIITHLVKRLQSVELREREREFKFKKIEAVLFTKGIMRQLNFDNVKKEIRSVLISAKEGLTLREFLKEYRSLVGIRLPTRELGYSTDIDLLNSIPNVVRVQENRDGSVFLKGIADETTEHIQKLVLKQKCVKKKTPNKGYVTNISRHNQISAPVNVDRYRPFVPATLRAEIIQIVKQHPQGIGYPTLTFEYNKTFSKNLSLMWLSSNPAQRLEKLVNAVPELKLITKGNSQKLFCVDNDQDVPEETDIFRSKHQNMKDTVPMSSPTSQPLSSVIPMSVRGNIEKVLKVFCKGILDKHFPILYQTCTKQTFDLHELGFTSLIDLTDALPEIFLRVKGKNPNDWLLFHVDNSKNVPENLEISNIKTSSGTYVSEEDVLKDIALPSSKYIQLNLPGEIETKFIPVFISAIINPNCFWFQLYTKEAIQRLKSLEKEMENFYNKLPSGRYKIANSDITVGAICALFCKDDSQWYRIVITGIPTIDDVVESNYSVVHVVIFLPVNIL
ncbi:tudor domain-containing protein 5 [Trichonephila clavipes]|nr:tudor domain-containing protein 5 [Trichonephila clavipes]